MRKATLLGLLAIVLSACGGHGFPTDAAMDVPAQMHTDVPLAEVTGAAACMRVEGWNNVASAACNDCAMTACGPEYAAYAGEGQCPLEIAACSSGCGGATDCTCRATCVAMRDMDTDCVAAWGAYDDCVANACNSECN